MDDEVGYKKPPKKHQFQPGQSGNSRRKRKDAGPVDAATLLGASVTITRNGRTMKIDPRQLAIESQFKRAFGGDIRSARAVIKLLVDADLLKFSEEDDHVYCYLAPKEWDFEEWLDKYYSEGPPPWPGERDGLIPIERRDPQKRGTK